MGKGHFKRTLSSTALVKKQGAPDDGSAAQAECAEALSSLETVDRKRQTAEPTSDVQDKVPCVYDDVSVCRYLGIRRRVLNAARKASGRGRDWDCVDARAGMTKAWIDAYALNNHIVPKFGVALEPIRPRNGVASVRLIGTHPNPEICSVEKVSDGKRMFAHIRNIMQFPIHLNECFDCMIIEGKLKWAGRYNDCQY